jgi:hypothetical protein
MHCGKMLSAPEHLSGTQQSCPHCRQLVPVPKANLSAAIPPVQQGAAMAAGQQNPPAKQGAENEEMWAAGEAAPAAQQSYVPVHCRICDTRMYATVADVGSDVTCPDCGAKTKVKMVATKKGQAPPISVPGDAYELSEPPPAMTMELVGYGTPVTTLHGTQSTEDELRKSAEKYVANRKRRKPPKLWMLRGVFLYPFSLSVIPNILLVATLWPIAYYVVLMIGVLSSSNMVAAAGSVFMILIAAALIGLAATTLATLLLAVVEVSSDGGDSIAGEFDLMFADRILRMLFLISAWIFALVPGEIVNQLAGTPQSWQLLPSTPLNFPALISLFLLLPVTQLSVLESASMVVPLSYNLLRGIRRNLGAWIAFYLVSGLIFPVTLGLLVLINKHLTGFFAAGSISFVVTFAIVIYYRLLGRLAWYSAENTQPLETKRSSGPYEPLYP